MTEEATAVEQDNPEQTISVLNNPADVFKDEPDTPEPKDEPEEKEKADEPKGEEKEDKDKDEPESPSDEDTLAENKALKAELARIRAKNRELKETPKKELPDPVDDPEGYAKALEDANSQARINDKLNISRDIMVDLKEDYEEAEKVFMGLIAEYDEEGNLTEIKDPSLHQKFLASPNPARFAYNHAKEHLRKENLDSENKELKAQLDEMKAKLEKLEKGTKSATELPDLTNAAASRNSGEKVTTTENPKDLF